MFSRISIMRVWSVPSLLMTLALSASSGASWAALGASADSVQADTLRMQATRHVAVRALYQVHELDLASGTVVREYVAANGAVFGVTWHGPFKPDLNQLLGNYFTRLVAAGQAPHPDHRMLRVADEDIVIESAGRMRAFTGRGYVPSLVPAGVAVSEIQ
jgi:hypothetical protein